MIQGKCPQCGQLYYGYALLEPDNQNCDNCGGELIITRGYSTFTGKPYEPDELDIHSSISEQMDKKTSV